MRIIFISIIAVTVLAGCNEKASEKKVVINVQMQFL
jgi:outer membrane murein-binding lipoprotein Lpp